VHKCAGKREGKRNVKLNLNYFPPGSCAHNKYMNMCLHIRKQIYIHTFTYACTCQLYYQGSCICQCAVYHWHVCGSFFIATQKQSYAPSTNTSCMHNVIPTHTRRSAGCHMHSMRLIRQHHEALVFDQDTHDETSSSSASHSPRSSAPSLSSRAVHHVASGPHARHVR
jgi:hypothetical protein